MIIFSQTWHRLKNCKNLAARQQQRTKRINEIYYFEKLPVTCKECLQKMNYLISWFVLRTRERIDVAAHEDRVIPGNRLHLHSSCLHYPFITSYLITPIHPRPQLTLSMLYKIVQAVYAPSLPTDSTENNSLIFVTTVNDFHESKNKVESFSAIFVTSNSPEKLLTPKILWL